MKLVIDTNVLIAAFIAHGVCADVFEHCARYHVIIASDFILDEFREHLACKFQYTAQETEEAVSLLRSRVELVTPTKLANVICRDPDDDIVLGTAIAGCAVCIITGDADLLAIKQFRGIDVVRPADFADYEATRAGNTPG